MITISNINGFNLGINFHNCSDCGYLEIRFIVWEIRLIFKLKEQ